MDWSQRIKELFVHESVGDDPHLGRYQRLQLLMKEKGVNHLFIEDAIDIYYLTGHYFSAGSFLAHFDNKADFMVDSRYYEALKSSYWRPHLIDKGYWQRFWQRQALKTLAFDPEKTSYARFLELSEQSIDYGMRLEPQKGLVAQLQRVKDSGQILKMAYAGQLASEAFAHAATLLHEDITEKQVARLIRLYFVERGAEVAFEPIVAFGDHAAIPHHSSDDRQLKKGDIVLIDLGAKLDHYCSDMARTFFFKEVSSPELEQWWWLVKEAYDKAVLMLKPGACCGAIDRSIRDFFRSADCEDRFTHSLGHGIGLRVHETPRIRSDSDYKLEEGSVIAIEPGLYLPSRGGVRLENSFAITRDGAVPLTSGAFEIII